MNQDKRITNTKEILSQIKDANESNLILDAPEGDPCRMEFDRNPYAEIGWIGDKITDGIYLHLSPYESQTHDELATETDLLKWEIFAELEKLLGRTFSEITDQDACSYEYAFIYRMDIDGLELTIKITDYLS